MAIKRGYVGTRDGQIHYRFCEGGKEPPVVFFHMIATSSECYEKIMGLLDGEYRMFAMDTPGFGQSFFPPQPPTITYYVSILLEALENLGVHEFYAFGHHTGAAISVEMAATARERLKGIMLEGPVYLTKEEARSFLDMLGKPVAIAADGSHLMKIWNHVVGLDPDHPPMLCHREAVDTLRAVEHFHEAFSAVFSQDYESMFSKVKCPTLFLCGENDLLMPYFKRVCDAYSNAKRVVLPGCGVYALDNCPELNVKEIRAFLHDMLR